MSCVNLIIRRQISTTAACCGKRNFKKFPLYGKRGTRLFKRQQQENPDPEFAYDRGVRSIGYQVDGKFIAVPEMIPEIIVPDLKDCKLKPYVSYRVQEIVQTEFTSEDLFNIVYAPKMAKDFQEGKLNEDGSSKEPSEEEKLTPEEALMKARQTGSDLF